MGRCFNSGGWYFSQIIDVENPSKDLEQHHVYIWALAHRRAAGNNSRSTPLGAYHKLLLVAPLSPGFLLLFVNNDHWSLVRNIVCVVLVLNTCGESRSSVFGMGHWRSQNTFFEICRTASLRATSNRTFS